MIKNYLLTALRNFQKQKLSTLIHVIGLSLGLIGGLVIFLFVHHHFSTDTFYPNANRIYRVVLDIHIENGSIEYEPGTSLPMAQTLKNEYATIEQAGFCRKFYSAPTISLLNQQGERTQLIEESGVAYADNQFIKMFDLHFIEGDVNTAMIGPNQVLLTRQQARKYFGNQEAIGQTININNKADLEVVGIVEDYPSNTDFDIDVWISLPTLTVLQPNYQTENYKWIGNKNWTFVKLAKNSDASAINKQLPTFVSKYLGDNFKHWKFHLQPLAEMHFDTRYHGTIRKPLLWLLSAVAVLIVLVACINFINLSTAQALSRSREVGVRKSMGSTRSQLFWQFIGETALLIGITLVLSAIFLVITLPQLNYWIGTNLTLQSLANPSILALIILLAIGIIFLAGSYPAIVLAGFDPIQALKNKISSGVAGGYQFRKWLVAFQFTVSQAFIIGALIILYQMNYFQKVDTGFREDAILTVDIPRSNYSTLATFRNRLQQFPAIGEVSFHHRPPMATMNDGGYVKFDNQDQWTSFLVRDRWADEHYIDTYDLELLAGRNLIIRDSATEFLVNEEFVRQLGVSSPEDVISKHLFEGNAAVQGVIVGVVSDFHHRSLQNPIEPVVIYPYPRLFRQAGIQIQPRNFTETLQTIQTLWEGTFPDQVFSYQLLEDSLSELYEKERTMSRLVLIFTIASIIICCLGLLGLVTYTISQRTKEVGVRKVLGASVIDILMLLSKDLFILLLISFVLSVPIANYFMQEWLTNFSYRIPIQWWMFILGGGLILFIALFSVGIQTVKAAVQNPVDSLRDE